MTTRRPILVDSILDGVTYDGRDSVGAGGRAPPTEGAEGLRIPENKYEIAWIMDTTWHSLSS